MYNYVGLKAVDMGFDAHLTVHYLGKQRKIPNPILEVLKRVSDVSFYVVRKNIEVFANNTPVVTVEVPEHLKTLNNLLEEAYPSPSEFSWNPHISLSLESGRTLHIPPSIKLEKLNVY